MTRRTGLLPQLLSLLGFTAVAAAWAIFLLAKGGGLPHVGAEPYMVSAVIPTGTALAPGSRVTMAGVQIGRVKAVRREGIGAMLKLEIKERAVLPLTADTRVQVRQHTPVGENYIALVAGRSTRRLASGDALPAMQADEFVDVDKLLSVLKGDARERARQTIQSLGTALDGREQQLNELLGDTARFLKPAGVLVDTLHEDRVQAARLVDQLGDVAAAIGQRDSAIHTIAADGLAGFRAIRSRDTALRRTIEELPASLRRIRSASATVQSVSAVTRPVVDDVTAALTALQPAVSRLRPAAEAGRGVVRELGAAAPGLRGTLARVTELSPPLSAALPKIRKTVCNIAPIVRYLKPYIPEGLSIAIGLGSASNSYDATGHLLRLAPMVSDSSASGLPDNVSAAASSLVNGGLLGRLGTAVNFDPYPKPGSLGRTVAASNKPLGPEGVPQTGFIYPHVKADC